MLRSKLVVGLVVAGLAHLSMVPSASSQGLLDKATESVKGAAQKVGDVAETAGETVLDVTDSATASEIDAGVDAVLSQLHASSPETIDLSDQSVAILIFPKITKGGLMVGGQFGEGAMREDGDTTGYYSIAGASYGFQAGVQQFFHMPCFFLNDQALEYFSQQQWVGSRQWPNTRGRRSGLVSVHGNKQSTRRYRPNRFRTGRPNGRHKSFRVQRSAELRSETGYLSLDQDNQAGTRSAKAKVCYVRILEIARLG